MKLLVTLLGWMVVGFAPGQSVIGIRAGLSDVRFFYPNDADLYYADYAVTTSPSIGLSWYLKGADGNIFSCMLLRDELGFRYDARQFITNASFANESEHQLTRYTLRGTRLWNVVSFGNAALYLGPGLSLMLTQVLSSHGKGFDTQLLQWTDSAGNVFTFPGPVYWAYHGRKPEAFHSITLSGALVVELQVGLSPRLGLGFGGGVELLLTPWVSEKSVRFTSCRTVEGNVGVYYLVGGER